MATENARVDMTFVGYILIGAVLLVLGIYGLEMGGLFGDFYFDSPEVVKDPMTFNLPVTDVTVASLVAAVGCALAFFTIFAYRTGAKTSAAVFGVLAVPFILMMIQASGSGPTVGQNGGWFVTIAFAIAMLVVALYLLLDRAPKFVALLVLIIGFMFLFFALNSCFCAGFEWSDPSKPFLSYIVSGDIVAAKAMGIVAGIFGIIGFFISTYLGLAYALPRAKLPLI